LPSLSAGATCPRTTGGVISPAYGAALGDGPVYPVGLGSDGILNAVPTSGGFKQKVLWIASSGYEGPILIRGGGLDSNAKVQFASRDELPLDELRLTDSSTSAPPGWRDWPSYTEVPSAGCYAYQIDGVGFTSIVVFEVATS
jgi:hypothetical protein